MSAVVEVGENARVATWARRMRRMGVAMLLLVGLGASVWLAREPLLRGAADLWIVSDKVTRSDVAVVLGGRIDVRPFAAADLYRRGLVKKILVSSNEVDRAAAIGASEGHTEANRNVLLKLGVPENAIETFGQANKSTRDEAIALREWVEHHGASTIIVPTELFTGRRVRWMLEREFAGLSIRIQVLSIEPPDYTRREWWRSATGLIEFQNEVIKYLYYRLEY